MQMSSVLDWYRQLTSGLPHTYTQKWNKFLTSFPPPLAISHATAPAASSASSTATTATATTFPSSIAASSSTSIFRLSCENAKKNHRSDRWAEEQQLDSALFLLFLFIFPFFSLSFWGTFYCTILFFFVGSFWWLTPSISGRMSRDINYGGCDSCNDVSSQDPVWSCSMSNR